MLKKIHTENAPKAIGPYSQGIIHNDIFYSSGQIPINPKSGNIEVSDIKDQTKQVMENLKAVLKEANSDFDNVIKTTCFLSDMSYFAEFNEVYAEYFNEHRPARSCVAVKELPKSVKVEVELIAVVK